VAIDFDALFAQAEKEAEAELASGRSGRSVSTGGDLWEQVWSDHGEGRGAFGGRDNALTKLLGLFRARRIPFEVAREIAHYWNSTHCSPPLDRSVVDDKVSRGWVAWAEGTEPDETPESLIAKPAPTRRLLMANDLLDMDDDPGSLWLVKNVLVRQGIHYISAPAAGGKSWVMLDLARAMTCEVPWIGKIEVPQGPVLYVDEEMGSRMTSDRIRKLGFKRDAEFYYLGKEGINLQKIEDCQYLYDLCVEKKIELVIIDTLTGVRPGLKENESEHVSHLRAVFSKLTTTGATLLIAHHDRKGRVDEESPQHEKMRGSGDFAAMADMVYGISKRDGSHVMKATKNRQCAEEDALNIEFELRVEDGLLALYPLNQEEKSRKRLDAMSQRIMDVLAESGPLSTNSLVEAVGGMKAVVITAAQKLVEDGELDVADGPNRAKLYAISKF